MVRYNVTASFVAGGSNNAVLYNTEPTLPHHVSLSGMVLIVVYEYADEPIRKIWINEGFDIISARTAWCVTSEEATAYVPFTGGTIEPGIVEKATLVTIMQDAFDGGDKNRLYFNDGKWHGIWDSAAKQGGTTIAINETDVLDTSRQPITRHVSRATYRKARQGATVWAQPMRYWYWNWNVMRCR